MRNSSIPTTWSAEPTLDLFYIKGRLGWKGLRASEFQEEGPFLITGTDFVGGKVDWSRSFHISDERFIESPEITVQPKDILITKDGTIGKVAFIERIPFPGKASLNSHLFLVRSRSKKIDQRFAFYIFQSYLFRRFIDRKQTGSTLSGLPQRLFEQFKVPLPPIDQQGQISEILSTVDEAIEQTEALIAKYRQIKAGLMHDLFTRGVTPDGHLRPSCAQAPHLYKESLLGWIPKEWDCLTVEELLAKTFSPMRSGPFGSALLKDELVEDGIPFLGIDNVFPECFVPIFRRFVPRQKFIELIRYAVFPGDVIITIMGTVGRCCVVPDHITEALSSKHLWTMTFDVNRVLSELACWQLNHARWVKDWFARYSQGAVMDAIQSSTLRSLRLPVPKIDEQKLILDRYWQCTRRIEIEKTYAAKLLQQKHGLMHDLLTGRMRVKGGESASA